MALLAKRSEWVANELLIAYTRSDRPGEAKSLIQEMVSLARKKHAARSLELASALGQHGTTLINLQAWDDAERLLREGREIRLHHNPNEVLTFCAHSALGAALLGQKKYDDAKKHLVTAYEGLKRMETDLSSQNRTQLVRTVDRLVQYAQETSMPGC